jgi:hypothetical protein
MTTYINLALDDQLHMLELVVIDSLTSVYVHPVKLELVWETPDILLEDMDEEFEDMDMDEIRAWVWDTVVLPSISKLTVFSKKTGNNDPRGGGCGERNVPLEDFTWTVNNPKGITLKELVECVYRLKGSKYDVWYETFLGFTKHKTDEDGALILETKFDYGS